MNAGDVLLIRLQEPGVPAGKIRPALLLAQLPGTYQNLLICGISTQLQQLTPDWDERIGPADTDYADSGLHKPSAIRLSYLYAATAGEIVGSIGRIDDQRLKRLRERLILRLQA